MKHLVITQQFADDTVLITFREVENDYRVNNYENSTTKLIYNHYENLFDTQEEAILFAL